MSMIDYNNLINTAISFADSAIMDKLKKENNTQLMSGMSDDGYSNLIFKLDGKVFDLSIIATRRIDLERGLDTLKVAQR